jgi:hypothetical protein
VQAKSLWCIMSIWSEPFYTAYIWYVWQGYHQIYVGWARTIYLYAYTVYIRFLSREITIHTAIYGACLRFWPTLIMSGAHAVYDEAPVL